MSISFALGTHREVERRKTRQDKRLQSIARISLLREIWFPLVLVPRLRNIRSRYRLDRRGCLLSSSGPALRQRNGMRAPQRISHRTRHRTPAHLEVDRIASEKIVAIPLISRLFAHK